MSWYRRLVPEPFLPLLTFAWIVGLFSVTTAPIQDLWRPLIVGVLVAAVLTVLAVAVRPADRWLVLAAGSAWLVLIGAWPLGLGVAVVVVWRLLVDGLRRRTGRRP